MELKDMTIGVIGGGVVGRATANAYAEHVADVRVYDVRPQRCTSDLRRACMCDLIFICLPESNIPSFFKNELTVWEGNFVIKSTVPVGMTRMIKQLCPNVVHSPEFLTSRCAVLNAQTPSRNVIGIPWEEDEPTLHNQCGRLLYEVYEKRFPGVKIHRMSSEESELLKLMQNSFFAVKVAFFNEAKLLADRINLDWPTILKALLADGRVHPSHTQVPGPDGMYGFGGGCLLKDLSTFRNLLVHMNIPSNVSQAALNRNMYDRGRNPRS